MYLEENRAVKLFVQDVVLLNKDLKISIHFLYKLKDSKIYNNHWLNIQKDKLFQIINVIAVRINVTLLSVVS
jgi:hypothetical protein